MHSQTFTPTHRYTCPKASVFIKPEVNLPVLRREMHIKKCSVCPAGSFGGLTKTGAKRRGKLSKDHTILWPERYPQWAQVKIMHFLGEVVCWMIDLKRLMSTSPAQICQWGLQGESNRSVSTFHPNPRCLLWTGLLDAYTYSCTPSGESYSCRGCNLGQCSYCGRNWFLPSDWQLRRETNATGSPLFVQSYEEANILRGKSNKRL